MTTQTIDITTAKTLREVRDAALADGKTAEQVREDCYMFTDDNRDFFDDPVSALIVAVLESDDDCLGGNLLTYQERRDAAGNFGYFVEPQEYDSGTWSDVESIFNGFCLDCLHEWCEYETIYVVREEEDDDTGAAIYVVYDEFHDDTYHDKNTEELLNEYDAVYVDIDREDAEKEAANLNADAEKAA